MPTICVGFDRVIRMDNPRQRDRGAASDLPVPGAREAIAGIRCSARVIVHSSRCASEDGREDVRRWLAKHGIEVDDVAEHKPSADLFIDTDTIKFNGRWYKTVAKVNYLGF